MVHISVNHTCLLHSLDTNTWVACICILVCLWNVCYKCNPPLFTYSECKLKLHTSAYYYMKGFLLFTEMANFGIWSSPHLQEGLQPRKYDVVPTALVYNGFNPQHEDTNLLMATGHRKRYLSSCYIYYCIGLWWRSTLVSHSWKYDG